MSWWAKIFGSHPGGRLACDIPGRLSVRTAPELDKIRAQWQVRVVDLSLAGAGLAASALAVDSFHLHQCLAEPENCPLELDLEFPGRRTVTVPVRLAWIKRDYGDPEWSYRLGLDFSARPDFPRGWQKMAQRTV